MSDTSKYLPKGMHIDLDNNSHWELFFTEQEFLNYLGGRGLGTYTYIREMGFDKEPLERDNAIIFAAGVLTGTNYPTATRSSCISRSPLTRTILSSNMGGRFGGVLRKTGYDLLMITGKLDNLGYLIVDKQGFSVEYDSSLAGLTTVETETLLKKKHSRAAILTIGPAGENQVHFASITHNMDNDFGRGGMGAILGSKNLKAIVVLGDRKHKIGFADKDAYLEHAKEISRLTDEMPDIELYKKYGTLHYTAIHERKKSYTNKNFKYNANKNVLNLSGEEIDHLKVARKACPRCLVACRHQFEVDGESIRTPEYESMSLLGPNLEQYDPKVVLKLTEYVSHLGMDSIDTGGVLGILQELVELGKLDPENYDDPDFLKQIMKDIAHNQGLGKEMVNGAYEFAKRYNEEYLVAQVKGMHMSAYEPRALPGQALGYGISGRGADHLHGGATVGLEALDSRLQVSQKAYSGKGKLVGLTSGMVSLIDSIGVCIHAYHHYVKVHKIVDILPHAIIKAFMATLPSIGVKFINQSPMQKAMKYVYGYDMKTSEFDEIAKRILTLERIYNLRAGFKRDDDILPDRFFEEDTPENKALKRSKYMRELEIFYKFQGWDSQGVPTPQTLKTLGINF